MKRCKPEKHKHRIEEISEIIVSIYSRINVAQGDLSEYLHSNNSVDEEKQDDKKSNVRQGLHE